MLRNLGYREKEQFFRGDVSISLIEKSIGYFVETFERANNNCLIYINIINQTGLEDLFIS